MLEFFTTFYLQDEILMKVDRASMMHGLETRAVFLDPEVVEFARKLPARFKIRNGVRKYILKKAMRPDLPPEVLERPKKGFGIPLVNWLRRMPIDASSSAQLGLDRRVIERAVREHVDRRRDHRLMLCCWLVLERLLDARQQQH